MTEPLDPDEDLVAIDVRSPGERMADSGRSGIERFQAFVERAPLGFLAACWMLALVVHAVARAYQSLRFGTNLGSFPGLSNWLKLFTLASSFGMAELVAVVVGLALAVFGEGSAARFAKILGVTLGVWGVLVSLGGIAVAMHGFGFGADISAGQRFSFGSDFFAQLAIAGVVTALAWGVLQRDRAALS